MSPACGEDLTAGAGGPGVVPAGCRSPGVLLVAELVLGLEDFPGCWKRRGRVPGGMEVGRLVEVDMGGVGRGSRKAWFVGAGGRGS